MNDFRSGTRPSSRVLVVALTLTLGHFVSPTAADDPILFEESIAPVLRQNCIACHHAKKAEGGLNLENFASLSRGGDSGAVIDPTAIDKSILLERVTGRVEPIMPPNDNTVDAKPLTSQQVTIFRRWIEGGAKSKATAQVRNSDYQPLPAHVQASYAMTLTPDGNWLAFARGNDLVFQPINDWSNLTATTAQQSIQQDAHRDICFAMAASPDGQRIATGSSEEVKIWRKRVARIEQTKAGAGSVSDELTTKKLNSSDASGPSLTLQAPAATKETGQADREGKPHLQFDGSDIINTASSRNGSFLATLDQEHRLRIWTGSTATLLQDHSSDYVQTLERQRLDRDIERQKRLVERWSAMLVELQAVVDKESKAAKAAKEAHDKAKTEWNSKNQELLTIMAAIAEFEKTSAPIQAAVEAAKQQITDLTEKQKQENAEVAKLQIAITGTQALLDLGNQKLGDVAALLEPKKKSLSELQPQEIAAKTKVESSQLAFHQSEESHRLAVKAIQKKQAQLALERKVLENLQAEGERRTKEATDLKILSASMTFTGDEKHLVVINSQNQLEVFTVQPLQRIAPAIPLDATFLTVQSVGNHEILFTGEETASQRWSIATQWEFECVLGPDLPGIITDRVNSLAFNHDGTKLAIGSGIGSRSGHLAILELGNLRAASLTSSDVIIELSEPEHHSDTILGLAYSPDGRVLASCSADKMTKAIDAETFKMIRNFEGHTHHVLGVAWHNDGVHLATTSGDGTAKVWDMETGETTRTLTVGKELTSLSFVGTTNRFVSTVIDHTLRMHDIESKDQIRQFVAAQNSLYATSVSPDGRFAIAIGQEGIPRVWQVEDGKLIAEIK